MKYGVSFSLVSVSLLLIALQHGSWFYSLIYPALSFAIVAIGYLGAGPSVFGKRSNGQRSLIATVILYPYLLFTLITWHLIRVFSASRQLIWSIQICSCREGC